jgi:CubicO group peptidase (beta-lactamase class C family)
MSLVSQVVQELKEGVPQWFEEQNIPGAAVAVVDDQHILWQGVYGRTHRESGTPINAETLFSIQSMSKSFTALGVLMAIQDGLLDLDTPITEYIPDFKVNSIFEEYPERRMTLRHLLAHRAGFTHEAPLGGNFDDRPHSFNEHILSIQDSWLRYPVGYRYSYSNLGIDLAGYILQEKAGMPFWDYIREKVFEPLGMVHSTCDVEQILEQKNRAVGHTSSRQAQKEDIPVFIPMIPAGGVYTNILDMADYLRFHINKGIVNGRQLLKKELIEEMHEVAFPEKYQRAGYGLCLRRNVISRTYYLQHGGGGYGFITSMVMYPELKLGVVTLTNSHTSRITGDRIMDIINGIIESRLGKTEPYPPKSAVDTSQPLPEDDERVSKLLGTYGSNVPLGYKDNILGIFIDRQFYPLKFYRDRQELVGVFGNHSELRVKPPLLGRGGTLVHLNRLNGSCRYYDFHKPEKARDTQGPDKPEWDRWEGRYQMLSWGRFPGGSLWIRKVNGHLTANGSRCFEYVPGLFFTYNGEALDFRGTIPTFRNIMLFKK